MPKKLLLFTTLVFLFGNFNMFPCSQHNKPHHYTYIIFVIFSSVLWSKKTPNKSQKTKWGRSARKQTILNNAKQSFIKANFPNYALSRHNANNVFGTMGRSKISLKRACTTKLLEPFSSLNVFVSVTSQWERDGYRIARSKCVCFVQLVCKLDLHECVEQGLEKQTSTGNSLPPKKPN